MRKNLVIFINRNGARQDILEQEWRIIQTAGQRYRDLLVLERMDIPDVSQICKIIESSAYHGVHLSMHRPEGEYLGTSVIEQELTKISAERLANCITNSPHQSPLLLFCISLFPRSCREALIKSAPFVITTDLGIPVAERIKFIESFYKKFFARDSVMNCFEYASGILGSEYSPAQNLFTLDMPRLITKKGKLYLECTARGYEDAVFINMDKVSDDLHSFGISREEVLHLIARRMPMDKPLLAGARNDALLPIGRALIGIFSWQSREDVTCDKLARVASESPAEQVSLWLVLLNSYNCLAASKYRNLQRPSEFASRHELRRAVDAFESHIRNHLLRNSEKLAKLGFRRLLPYVARAETECAKAHDRLLLKDYRAVVFALETALTHYHSVVSGVQPRLTTPQPNVHIARSS